MCTYLEHLKILGNFLKAVCLFDYEWLGFCFEIKLMSIKHFCDKNLITKFCCLFCLVGFFK